MKTITKFLFALFVLLIGASSVHAEKYIFSSKGGNNNWHNLNNWSYYNKPSTQRPGKLPTINDTLWICEDVVISSAALATAGSLEM